MPTVSNRACTSPRLNPPAPGLCGLLCITLALALVVGAAAPARGDAPAAYRIATVAWMGWSPLHVAQAKGMWAELGLAVQVVDYDDPMVIVEAIKAGAIDFAMDMAGSLAGIYMQGEPVVALAETDWSHGGDKILIRPGDQLAGLVDRPVGVFLKLPSCLYFLGLGLARHGMRLNQFRVVEIGAEDLAEQFMAGRLPLMVNYQPWVDRAIKATGARVLATSADFPGAIPECMWCYRPTLARVPREHLVKLIMGWIAAVRWSQDKANWGEYQDILNQRTFAGHPSFSAEKLSGMLASVRIHGPDMLARRNQRGGGLDQYFTKLKAFLKANNLLARDFTPAELFDPQYVMEAVQRLPQIEKRP